MINRYSLSAEAEAVAQRFSVDPTPGYEPVYNAAPTQLLPVMTQESPNGMSFFYWGLPPVWAKDKPLGERWINTPAEQISEKPSLRKKLVNHRCLIPADGFYVWKRIGKKAAIPYRFTLPGKEPFAVAGFWEEYEDENNVPHHTFSMITTEGGPSVSGFSTRMPALLAPEQENDWLKSESVEHALAMLVPYPGDLFHYSVSTLVNDPARNDKRVILPAPAADQFGNLTLFD
ncbi:MAG: SOS response-associated peptidase [Cyclobacteriaceae bacterium]|nr:SOS response-associated peptidase [Cyclobacteriaceae bacterium]